ncbi:MMPL family transporter [uncultured Bacteroides sp.]|uniref:MMPL family transporter n=1 Tax=uncultured Bacteroides sp. TaxID=162156 RepID=UPI0026241F75|nr:MMPL family transporter [uncultured Bacteroides sp.]
MLTYQHMSRQMEKNSKDLHSPLGSMYPELIQIDPIGIRELLLQQFKTLSSNSNGGYKIIDGHFFVPDSTVCVAFITPSYSSTNTGQGAELFRTINGLIEKFNSISPDIKICYHGTPASGFYNASQIKSDLKSTITASLILVLVILVVCFRNYNTITLLILPVAFGVVFGLAAMYFIKGEFSLLSLGIGAVVLGVAFSYVLHILTHYKYVSNPEKVLTDQVRPISLGCITTIGSFMGLMFVRTELLRDFGLFASLSIIGTTIFSFIYLPQLLDQNKNKINKKAFSIIERANNYPYDKKKVLIISSIVIILICSGYYIIGGTRFDANMHDLGYRADITSYSENLLRNKTYTGDKQKYFASSGKTMEEAINNFGVLDYKLDSLKKKDW